MTAPHLVFTIHGTFAASDDETGIAWWQRGSPTWKVLEQKLPANVHMPANQPLFGWSGQNTEWARYKAGIELYDWLQRYESRGQPYHIVAHSHGGSAVWGALKESIRRGTPLNQLKSWTTFGTPFIKYRPVTNGIPALIAAWFLFVTYVLTASAPLWVLALYHFRSEPGQQTGVTHPLVILGAVAAAAIGGAVLTPLVYFGARLLRVRREVLWLKRDKRVEREAMHQYGGRWLGIWSKDDEAIGGLKATVGLKISLLTPFTFTKDIPYYRIETSRIAEFGKMANLFLFPWINRFLIRWGNKNITSVLTRTMQGNNRPGALVDEISAGPIWGPTDAYLPIPPALNHQLVTKADKAAQDLIPKIRPYIGQLAMKGFGVGQFATEVGYLLKGEELIHTSYYRNAEVLDLVCLHVAEMAGSPEDVRRTACNPALCDWYRRFRQSVQSHVLSQLDVIISLATD